MTTDTTMVGRVALVNGGAGAGIGGAIVERLRKAGACLVVTDVSAKRIEAMRERLDGDPLDHLVETMDASDEDAVRALFAKVQERLGRLDVLVNAVGINRAAPIPELALEDWKRVLDVSLTSHFLHIRAAWPLLEASDKAAIVNISSVAAWSPTALGEAHYAAAKAGVLGLTRAAAAEGAGIGIRANAVAPGLIWNEHLSKAVPEAYQKAYEAMSLVGRGGQPEDVANVVHFLASDASLHVTGETITVAGGHLARH